MYRIQELDMKLFRSAVDSFSEFVPEVFGKIDSSFQNPFLKTPIFQRVSVFYSTEIKFIPANISCRVWPEHSKPWKKIKNAVSFALYV